MFILFQVKYSSCLLYWGIKTSDRTSDIIETYSEINTSFYNKTVIFNILQNGQWLTINDQLLKISQCLQTYKIILYTFNSTLTSNPQRAAEAPGCIIRCRAIVIYKNMVIAAITEEGTAEFSDSGGCLHPARCFRIEMPELL